MFSRLSRGIQLTGVRNYNVAVLGASGGIGQSLSLLLKVDPKVTQLSLFDVIRTPGVAADLSHISTGAKTTGYVGSEQLSDVSVILH